MINKRITVRLLALPVLWMGLVQFFFALLSWFVFRDHVIADFFYPALVMIIAAISIFYAYGHVDMSRASYKDALLYATLTWLVAGILGAIPIKLVTGISFVDAVFESISALTTTGATVLTGLDDMSPTFLMYRQFLQWMGGLGIVIFVVAVLPMLNIGGMKLLKAETPGPVKDDKLSPRITNTAHYLWIVYIGITLACALAYYWGGMTAYDAIAHAFTTVSTGGFSTHDASMWFYQSHTLLWISNVFMLLGAISFALHFRVFYSMQPGGYVKDEETRIFLYIIAFLSLFLGAILYFSHTDKTVFEATSFSTFHIISFITSTGYGAADLSTWPAITSFLLIFTGYLGGCAGSTAGGNKIIRNIITTKVINRNIKELAHPYGVFNIKYQGEAVSRDVSNAVMAFMSVAACTSFVLTMLLMWTGLDFWSAFSAVAACLNVLGPGFGEVAANFQPVNDVGTTILSLAMILGRLEYFTLFALFTRTFWDQ